MRSQEYERRRRALDEQFREDVELLRAGHQAKLRALEMLWLASPGEAPPAGRPASETVPREEVSEPMETLETPEPKGEGRRRGQVMEDVTAVFPELPEEFDQHDVVRLLGYQPPRATLHRAFRELLQDRSIVVQEYSTGRAPTRYRKLPEEPDGEPG